MKIGDKIRVTNVSCSGCSTFNNRCNNLIGTITRIDDNKLNVKLPTNDIYKNCDVYFGEYQELNSQDFEL